VQPTPPESASSDETAALLKQLGLTSDQWHALPDQSRTPLLAKHRAGNRGEWIDAISEALCHINTKHPAFPALRKASHACVLPVFVGVDFPPPFDFQTFRDRGGQPHDYRKIINTRSPIIPVGEICGLDEAGENLLLAHPGWSPGATTPMVSVSVEQAYAATLAASPRYHPAIAGFDAIEVHPCCSIGRDLGGREQMEQCDRDSPDIAVWSVYGHQTGTGLDCLGDYRTERDAEFQASQLEQLLAWRRNWSPLKVNFTDGVVTLPDAALLSAEARAEAVQSGVDGRMFYFPNTHALAVALRAVRPRLQTNIPDLVPDLDLFIAQAEHGMRYAPRDFTPASPLPIPRATGANRGRAR